jgi:hypothetical protein
MPEEVNGIEFVSKFVEKWKEIIDGFAPSVENSPEELEKMGSNLYIWLEFADLFKDLASAMPKLLSNYKTSPFFIEMACKLLKKCLENTNLVQIG